MGILALSIILSTTCPPSFTKNPQGTCDYNIPYVTRPVTTGLQKGFPSIKSSLHPKRIDLGRYLFFDKALSGDGTISCADCHQVQRSLSDGKPRSVGKGNTLLTRSAPSLWNVAFQESFFWDGREKTLEAQTRGPLFAPHEMGNTPGNLERTLNSIEEYRRLFREAFGTRRITVNHVARALADFERTLVSFNSRYDAYVYGDTKSLNDQEVRGLNVFRSFVTRCTECHTPPLFTNQQSAIIGAPEAEGLEKDLGMATWTKDQRLSGSFKIPTLRNIAATAPYMHSGGLETLHDVVRFYNEGGGRAPGKNGGAYTHWHIRPMGISETESRDLIAFLGTLGDESALPAVPLSVPSQSAKRKDLQ